MDSNYFISKIVKSNSNVKTIQINKIKNVIVKMNHRNINSNYLKQIIKVIH